MVDPCEDCGIKCCQGSSDFCQRNDCCSGPTMCLCGGRNIEPLLNDKEVVSDE